jgi:hypothetical protein
MENILATSSPYQQLHPQDSFGQQDFVKAAKIFFRLIAKTTDTYATSATTATTATNLSRESCHRAMAWGMYHVNLIGMSISHLSISTLPENQKPA